MLLAAGVSIGFIRNKTKCDMLIILARGAICLRLDGCGRHFGPELLRCSSRGGCILLP